jgi:hypothetical protein
VSGFVICSLIETNLHIPARNIAVVRIFFGPDTMETTTTPLVRRVLVRSRSTELAFLYGLTTLC